MMAFLDGAGWTGAQAVPLAGDASSRRYLRLHLDARTAILMDAPVATQADRASYDAFRSVAAHLRAQGLSAPEEFAADPAGGLILMEDLGDRTLSHLLDTEPDTARQAYGLAATLSYGAAGLTLAAPRFDEMAQMVELTFEALPDSADLRARLLPALARALEDHASGPSVLSLRDVHGDNLLWLPERDGPARIGLLDFQDAVLLPEGYDLASLLDDPRRVVPEAWRDALIARHSTPARVNVLSVQRNLRILGIFRRLSTTSGKPAYARFLPRTREVIARAAQDLPELRGLVAEVLERSEAWDTP